jgi:cell division protein FtsI (penicillin-binding protein 3)
MNEPVKDDPISPPLPPELPAAKSLPAAIPPQLQARRVLRASSLFIVLICTGLLGVVVRVGYLQATADRRPVSRVVATQSRGPVLARRGALLDRHGRVLAATHVGHRLYADPGLIDDWSDFAVHVAHAIDRDPAQIEQTLTRAAERRYVVLHELLDEAQMEAVRRLELKGLAVEPRSVRRYPQGSLAAQLVGFVGREHKGLDGVEFALDGLLQGRAGNVDVLRDVHRRALWIEREGLRPAADGMDVRLSIDSVIQEIAETELDAVCRKHRAQRGEILVMDARTGQLLAMANWPFFDIMKPTGREADKARRNRCVTDPFEPGSIFKPFVHAAATSAGVARIPQLIDCTDSGYWVTSFGRGLRDVHAHGRIDWGKVLVLSSNIGMGKVGEQMGARRMYEAVRAFGFGAPSGVALPGESVGIVNPIKKWTKYSVTSVPMGQEIAVTPVQMVRAFSAFANGGLIVSPSILADETVTPIYQRAVDAGAANDTRQLLRRVVTEGTGRNAKSDRYQIWGKTGTAQVPDRRRGGYKPNAYTASFICGAPLKDPKIIVLVTVHEPNPKIAHYGGVVAAPSAKTVVERTLTYLAVPPDVVDEDHRSVQTAAAGD